MVVVSVACEGYCCYPALPELPTDFRTVKVPTGLRFASDEWARSLGAVCVLQEPITPDELLKEINRQVD